PSRSRWFEVLSGSGMGEESWNPYAPNGPPKSIRKPQGWRMGAAPISKNPEVSGFIPPTLEFATILDQRRWRFHTGVTAIRRPVARRDVGYNRCSDETDPP